MIHKLPNLTSQKAGYAAFIEYCRDDSGLYRLTKKSEPSPYALCFAIFGHRLIGNSRAIGENREHWDHLLRRELARIGNERRSRSTLGQDKAYLQLLTFTLSALAILGTLRGDPLAEQVAEVMPQDVSRELRESGALNGKARSGNHAMFMGILLLHARDYLQFDIGHLIDDWLRLHLQSMNRHGFWGDGASMSHLQFQNGYHQYELLEYLHATDVPWGCAADAVASLADREGHFAPYPGGGGCYDYDAVFLLTAGGEEVVARHAGLLARTAGSIWSEQNPDGGFCESLRVRPRSLDNLSRTARHILSVRGAARAERIRYGLTLLRPKHDRIHTHWTAYSREWSESDLWDSWFRMLTLARIEVALDPSKAAEWGFIDYPGIGFHPSVRQGAAS